MGEWQPIETAPKDGRHIIALIDTSEDSHKWEGPHIEAIYWWEDHGWGHSWGGACVAPEILGWMPVPSPLDIPTALRRA